jgi:hypothetical protein
VKVGDLVYCSRNSSTYKARVTHVGTLGCFLAVGSDINDHNFTLKASHFFYYFNEITQLTSGE